MNRLPTSDQEIKSLVVLSAAAGIAALARALYGKDELSWRFLAGSILTAMTVSMIAYTGIINVLDQSEIVSGYIAVATGCGCGLFLDDVMKRIHAKIFRTDDSGDKHQKVAPVPPADNK